jgi:hypothetical protein
MFVPGCLMVDSLEPMASALITLADEAFSKKIEQ